MRVTRNKRLVLTLADDERRTVSGADQQVMVSEKDAKPPGASKVLKGVLYGFKRGCSTLQFERHHLYEHLRIRFAEAFHTSGRKASPEMLVILDDTVVDKVDGSINRGMRVGVDLCHTSVGGPSRVSNASCPGYCSREDGFQVGHLPHGFVGLNL
jgi:hypothetical protein